MRWPRLLPFLTPLTPLNDGGGRVELGNRQLSFEFFPPKNEQQQETFERSRDRLAALGPSYMSVTFGAGGSTRARTFETVRSIAEATGVPTAPHISCMSEDIESIRGLLDDYRDNDASNGWSCCAAIVPRAAVPACSIMPSTWCASFANTTATVFISRWPAIQSTTRNRQARRPTSSISATRSTPVPTERLPNTSSVPKVISVS